MVYTIPKYTQYQLSKLVGHELESKNISIQQAAFIFSVNEEILQDILGKQVRYKSKHYQVVSAITGISVEELLEDEVVRPISFRSDHDKSDSIVVNKIEKISSFFREVALLKKLNGEIRVNDRGIL